MTQCTISLHSLVEDVRVDGSGLGQIVPSDAFYSSSEPSPVTPVDNNLIYDILFGAIKAAFH